MVNLDTESCREIVHTEIYNSQIDMKLSLLYIKQTALNVLTIMPPGAGDGARGRVPALLQRGGAQQPPQPPHRLAPRPARTCHNHPRGLPGQPQARQTQVIVTT